jgi:hypothetical protein
MVSMLFLQMCAAAAASAAASGAASAAHRTSVAVANKPHLIFVMADVNYQLRNDIPLTLHCCPGFRF